MLSSEAGGFWAHELAPRVAMANKAIAGFIWSPGKMISSLHRAPLTGAKGSRMLKAVRATAMFHGALGGDMRQTIGWNAAFTASLLLLPSLCMAQLYETPETRRQKAEAELRSKEQAERAKEPAIPLVEQKRLEAAD